MIFYFDFTQNLSLLKNNYLDMNCCACRGIKGGSSAGCFFTVNIRAKDKHFTVVKTQQLNFNLQLVNATKYPISCFIWIISCFHLSFIQLENQISLLTADIKSQTYSSLKKSTVWDFHLFRVRPSASDINRWVSWCFAAEIATKQMRFVSF